MRILCVLCLLIAGLVCAEDQKPKPEELAKERLAEVVQDPPQKGRECAYRLRITAGKEDGTLEELMQTLERWWGTAIAIEKHKVITCAHCVTGAKRFELEIKEDDKDESSWVEAKVEKVDEDLDLALLTVEDVNLHPVQIDTRRDTKQGEMATGWGSPKGEPLQSYYGVLVQHVKMDELWRVFDVKVDFGCSGGPIVSADGKLIGMVQEMQRSDHCAIYLPARRILQFLKEEK